MAPKQVLFALAVCGALALAGCTSGHDGGNETSTSTSGGYGAGGCVTGPAGSACSNVTASGSASSTNSSTGPPPAPMAANVVIEDMKFTNDSVTIKVGGTVTWKHNDGTQQHTVTADDGSFDSSPSCSQPVTPLSSCMKNGDSYTVTFATLGDVKYHCKVHPEMTGVVHVVA
jgi:plastocyanin